MLLLLKKNVKLSDAINVINTEKLVIVPDKDSYSESNSESLKSATQPNTQELNLMFITQETKETR